MLEEGREKQAAAEKKAREKKERMEKKAKLENNWEMLRWITMFIEKNKDRWEEEAKERRNDQREKSADWVRKSKEEKILTLKVLSEVDKWEETRVVLGTFKTPEVHTVVTNKNEDFEAYKPGEERRAEDGEVNDSGGGAHAAQLSEGDDGADQDGAQSSSVGLEACLPMSTHTHSAQPKLVRKQGRSTEEETDNRDGAHPEQQGEEDCQDRVESVGTDLPGQLVENLPVQLVKKFTSPAGRLCPRSWPR